MVRYITLALLVGVPAGAATFALLGIASTVLQAAGDAPLDFVGMGFAALVVVLLTPVVIDGRT